MDPELGVLASTAAATLVKLLATESWEKSKTVVGALWRHFRPERADRVEAEIVDAREDLLAAAGRGEDDTEIVTIWAAKLRALLAAEPDAAAVLRDLLAQQLPSTGSTNITTVTAIARDFGSAYTAGRDMHISGGPSAAPTIEPRPHAHGGNA